MSIHAEVRREGDSLEVLLTPEQMTFLGLSAGEEAHFSVRESQSEIPSEMSEEKRRIMKSLIERFPETLTELAK